MPEVAVVIGNYRGEHLLPDCLASLTAQTLAPSEVVVVDGASPDRSIEVAESLGARVLKRENRGLGHLYNEGAGATAAEFVLLLNSDVALDNRCLELLAAALAADSSLFAADPRQVAWEGGRDVKARTTLARGRLLREFIPSLHLDDNVPSSKTVPTVSAHGAAMLVRRELLLELGGFDETFFLEWEDLDLCWRAWLRGYGSVYVPDAWLRHRVGGATESGDLTGRLSSSHHNLLRFALKCLPAGQAARVLAGELLRLPAHPRLIAPALVRVARELPEIARQRRQAQPVAETPRLAARGDARMRAARARCLERPRRQDHGRPGNPVVPLRPSSWRATSTSRSSCPSRPTSPTSRSRSFTTTPGTPLACPHSSATTTWSSRSTCP